MRTDTYSMEIYELDSRYGKEPKPRLRSRQQIEAGTKESALKLAKEKLKKGKRTLRTLSFSGKNRIVAYVYPEGVNEPGKFRIKQSRQTGSLPR